ncbi:hypothetical protein [Streptomyces venezuelae]|uniref:Uncharacterized protein n=1 Tax=Streptomyces venezuelae TaxID=54571 RepID=A0A5P2BUV0_STRVZ|nr:hypothetical protein [Streptomyces venezuelae]QES32189.1 hypothetical protein DEJ48_01015 [Streptomyces venezuelae]
MSYGTPEESGVRTYTARAVSKQQIGEYRLTVTCRAETDNMMAPEVEVLFQKFMDTLSASPDFTVTAQRTTEFAENITATT